MANVIIKDEARRAHEAHVLGAFKGGGPVSSGDREFVELLNGYFCEFVRVISPVSLARPFSAL